MKRANGAGTSLKFLTSLEQMTSQNTIVLSADDSVSPKPALMKRLSFLDRFLSLWILLAMVGGALLGIYYEPVRLVLDGSKIDGVSLPVFIGLVLMLYPVFCKVHYENLGKIIEHKQSGRYILFSLVLNWIVCPLFMSALAWATLPDLPEYRTGVLLIG